MRLLVILGILLLLASVASAENLTDIFAGNDSSISPPPIGGEAEIGNGTPQEGLAMAETAGNLKLAAAAPSWPPRTLTLLITDANTGQLIKNAHIRLFMTDGDERLDTLRFVGADGKISLQLRQGTWTGTLKLDITSTVGKDYYFGFETPLENDTELIAYMQPVGSLMGEVFDSQNNLVPGASVSFKCAGDYGLAEPITTDQLGAFSAEWLPVGSCKVSAISGNKAGSQTVQIAQGQLSEVRLTLEQSVIAKEDYSWVVLSILAVVIVVIIVVFLRRKHEKPKAEEGKQIAPDKHMGDILSALDENEKPIIELLMRSGGKSLQNKIGRELGLPKSSLSRAIGGLEARNLIKTEKLGRIKRVELSDWFLNGKKPK